MPPLGLGLASERADERRRERRTRRRALPAASPDSASSAGGGGRSSFGSDLESVLSHLSFSQLAGREGGELDPDREKGASFPHCDTSAPPPPPPADTNHSPEPKEGEDKEEEDEDDEDPASRSFSIALRECQNRRFGSESLSSPGSKPRKRRPSSLDLNGPTGIDAAVLSPRFLVRGPGGVKRGSAASSRSRSGAFPSPGTPSYRVGMAAGYQKGWSSERVPLPSNSGRRYVGGSALLPFNNGRALPSKWDDAEKWICSPVDGAGRSYVPPPHHRRPKSKSGPLGAPTGIGGPYSSAASPMVPCFDSGRVGSFAVASPFMAGVLVADRGCCASYSSAGSGGGGGSGDGGRRSSSANAEPYILRSASVHGWSDAPLESSSSLPSSQSAIQDEKHDSTRETDIVISPVVLRKDVATQMSPDGSVHSSPKGRPFSPSSPSSHSIEELGSHLSKIDVRDVQVDDHVTMTWWSKKHIIRGSDKHSSNIVEWKKKTVEARGASWEVAESTNCTSKYKREEAKIAAWENLQKAKAEAAIRKLEVKLEKKRSSSMDKILNKLRSAQRKAQEMQSAVNANQSTEVARTTKRVSSLSGCFTCHAF